jgi:hypothetical protein
MRVERVAAFRRLAGGTDVEARRLANADMLLRVLGDPGADDREILLLVEARRGGVDEAVRQGTMAPRSRISHSS